MFNKLTAFKKEIPNGSKECKARQRDERLELILKAANEIIFAEGIDNLSVRKIASRIEYSPLIIYHYFRHKDDIIDHLMGKSYQRILSTLASAQISTDEPKQKLKATTRNYISLALQMPDEYMAIMLSSSPGILMHKILLISI